ncbi:hypothetical protein FRB95_003837 [Tulasnella sp. JGI-2019a]|nr:hypothetical protein FRB95_003837 [Tulasnella sp. JGI-2019a]
MPKISLASGRDLLLNLIGDIPSYPMQEMLDNLLPSVELNDFQPPPLANYFTNPSEDQQRESQVFGRLAEFFNTIATNYRATNTVPMYVRMRDTPNATPLGSEQKHRPDACLVVDDDITNFDPDPEVDNGAPNWFNVAAIFEYKKAHGTTHWRDNARKILWSMAHIMNYDPRRRSVVGFTIENVWLRMWYCDRAGFLVSHKVDIIDNTQLLVQLFLSLSIATPERLGYDPTMQIVPHSRQFRIVVTGTEQYLTEKVLCDHRTAGAVIGQATRVWSVRALNADGEPTGDPLALKDVWVREGSPREGDIVSAILEQADNDPISATIRAELIAHLINVRAHGDVKILGASDTISRNRRDHIFGLSEDRGYLTLKEDMAQFVTGSSVFSSVGSSGFDRLDRLKHFEANFPTTFSNRVHYRVVYSEVAQVFSQLTTIRDGYRAVAGASRALAALQLLGWVHRDLSMGNVYLSSNGAGKISDLEYARKLIDSNGREDKDLSHTVGTLNTVACEVIEQTYYFDVPGPPTMVEIPKLKYNHLHDAESLW